MSGDPSARRDPSRLGVGWSLHRITKQSILLATFVLLAPVGAAQTCEQLELLTTGIAHGVSADGRVVVGVNSNGAYRWTAAGGLQMLAAYPGQARGVSADGSTVVGFSGDLLFGTLRAFRWTAATGLVDLGTLGGAQARAWDISADGRVIVGAAMTSGGRWHPFRWTAAGGMQDLGAFGSAGSSACCVSADGSTVIGGYADAAHTVLAFRWTAQSGMQSLGTFAPGGFTVARNVSADGSVVVGSSAYSTSGTETAFRWTAAAGMEDLGGISGGLTHAWDVSADGETVVGWLASPAGGFDSFRWRRDTGFVELGALYDETFLVYACTPDANVLVGQGLLGGATGSLRLPLCWLGEEYCGPSVSNSSLRVGATISSQFGRALVVPGKARKRRMVPPFEGCATQPGAARAVQTGKLLLRRP